MDRLLDLARERSGLTQFGIPAFQTPLRILLECASRDVDFHTAGLEAFRNDILRWLINRLRMRWDFHVHPEIAREDVSDPFIVIGMGRSGTTKLHKMLSAADGVQKTLFWRMWNPARFPDAPAGRPDLRIAAAGTSQILSSDKPELDAAHHMEQGEVEEDWMLYLPSFEDWIWCQFLPIPSYFDWLQSRPSLETYSYVKAQLQYLQWQDGGKRERPWVLKSVGHIVHMDSLLACYPGATLIHPHRDPREAIPSYAKLLAGMWAIASKPLDPRFVGRETLRMMSAAISRYLEARDRLGLDARIVDVPYEQVRRDPMTAIRSAYRSAGRRLSAGAEAQMLAWHRTNEQGQHGRHSYSLEEFGLTQSAIDDAFAAYRSRFIRH